MQILFSHLPKTAGSSLVANLQSCLDEGSNFFHLDPNGRKRNSITVQFENFIVDNSNHEENENKNVDLIDFYEELAEEMGIDIVE